MTWKSEMAEESRVAFNYQPFRDHYVVRGVIMCESYIHLIKIKACYNGDQSRPFLWGFIKSVIIRE